MNKEKFSLIIIKLNQMNTGFGEDISLHLLLKPAVELGRDRWRSHMNAVMNVQVP
jgi:hypothetical protein